MNAPRVFSSPHFAGAALPLGITAWPRCQSMRQGENADAAGYRHDRNPATRGNLPLRPLAVRARADAGLLRQYQRAARRRRLAGDADQRLARLLDPARLSRLDADGRLCPATRRPRKFRCTPRCTRPAAPRARWCICIPPIRWRCRCCRRSIPRAALPPMTAILPDEVRAHRAGALLSPGRSCGGRRHQGAGGEVFFGAARQSRPGGSGDKLEAAVFATEELEETAKLHLLLRGLNPRFPRRRRWRI